MAIRSGGGVGVLLCVGSPLNEIIVPVCVYIIHRLRPTSSVKLSSLCWISSSLSSFSESGTVCVRVSTQTESPILTDSGPIGIRDFARLDSSALNNHASASCSKHNTTVNKNHSHPHHPLRSLKEILLSINQICPVLNLPVTFDYLHICHGNHVNKPFSYFVHQMGLS